MKILFDHRLFYQVYGGASKYFVMMIKNLPKEIWTTTALWPCNEYAIANNLFPCYRKRFKGQGTLLELLNRPYTRYIVGKQKFDIMHQTGFDNYFYDKLGNKPLVVTYHDSNLSTIDPHPEIVSQQRKALARANAIITVSNNTKKDLLKLFDIDEKKVHVIYHGIQIPIMEDYDEKRIISQPYFLYVGRRSTYKNFARAAKAFAKFKSQYDNVVFVCTSKGFTNDEYLMFKKLGIEKNVLAIKASEKDMVRLYRDAIALVFPSYYEGFGMPILEAWSCHCPVLLSYASCFPEIAGKCALYFNPDSEDEIYRCMINIYEDQKLRNNIILLGNKRVKKFSWQHCSEEHLKVYNKIR